VFYWQGVKLSIAGGKRPRYSAIDRVFPAYELEEFREHRIALGQDEPTEERVPRDELVTNVTDHD